MADDPLSTPFGLPRYLLLRWYIFHGVLFATTGVYLFIAAFYPKFLERRPWRIASQALTVELGIDDGVAFPVFTRTLFAAFFALVPGIFWYVVTRF